MTFALKKLPHPPGYSPCDEHGNVVKPAYEFLRALHLAGLSPHTLRAYAHDLLLLLEWLQCRRLKLEALTAARLLDFIAREQKRGSQPNSINRRLATISSYYRFATGAALPHGKGAFFPAPHYKGPGREHHLGLHTIKKPHQRLLRVKVPQKLIDPLTPHQVKAFLGSLRRYRDLCIAYLMLLCGLRSQEVISLTLGDVFLGQCELRVHGKGNKQRMLPLPAVLHAALVKYLQFERPAQCEHDRLFVILQGPQRGTPMTNAGFRSLFRHRRLRPGLSNANPHRWRHTCAVNLARNQVRLPTLQRILGHADPKTTLQYINLSLKDITDEFQRALANLQAAK